MKAEAQRVAIAGVCGWTRIRECSCKEVPRGYHCGKDVDNHLPDYLADLNACHEMEKALTLGQCVIYNRWLECFENTDITSAGCVRWNFHATAPQRCEAFLRTLNLWIDEPPKPRSR